MKMVKLSLQTLEVELYSEDEKTKQFNHIISDYVAHYTRHRQRRHAPFITNPHYLAPDVLEASCICTKSRIIWKLERCCNRCSMFIITVDRIITRCTDEF